MSQNNNNPAPMRLTSFVTTDLCGITRGRSLPESEVAEQLATGCGWVPANSALTPQDIIADDNPWGSHGDLRLLPDPSSRVRLENGPDSQAAPLDYLHGDLVTTTGAPWPVCPRTLLRDEIARYRELGLQVTAAFEHEFNLLGLPDERAAAFSLQAQRQTGNFGGWLMSALEQIGAEPEMFLPEYGRNQYEVTCRPTQGVAAADRAVNVREVTREIARQFGAAGIPTAISGDVRGALWGKLVINCVYNALSALSQQPYGWLAAQPGVDAVMADLLAECEAVARADGVTLPPQLPAMVRGIAESMPDQLSSTAQDLARGKPSEIDHLNGYVVHRGEALGIATPVNRVLQVLVQLAQRRAAGLSAS